MNWNYNRLYRRFGLNLKYGFMLKKPLLLSRLLVNGIKLIAGKGPLLRTVDFAPTYKCNANCAHCFASNFKRASNRKELSVADYGRCASEAMELGAVHFAFQGGEPLILENLEDIVRACFPERNMVAVTTNALLLTRKRIRSLKKAGVDLFTISLDSGDPEKHDRFRRHKGAYRRAVKAATDALDHGVNVTFNTVVSHESLYDNDLIGLVEFTRTLGVKLNILYAVPMGAWAGNESVLLTDEDKVYMETLFLKYPHIRRDLDANYMVYGCGAMKEVIYVNCYGDVMPCPYIHVSMGNVFDEPMKRIWGRGIEVEPFQTYTPVCLAAEDLNFIRKHLSAAFFEKELPVDQDKMFPGSGGNKS